MKCNKCGFEQENDFVFCPQCGNPAASGPEQNSGMGYQEPPKVTYTAKTTGYGQSFEGNIPNIPVPPQEEVKIENLDPRNRARMFILDSKFLIICMLMSLNIILSLFTIVPLGFSVLSVLMTIFLWVAYGVANQGKLQYKHIRRISGVCAAKKIVSYVCTGLILAGGILCMILLNSAGAGSLAELIMAYAPYSVEYYTYISPILSASGMLILVVCIIVAVIIFLFAFFGLRSIHLFVKSVYKSVETGYYAIEKRSAAAGWLMAYGVLSGIGIVGGMINPLTMVRGIIQCIVYVLFSILVNKYYKEM